MAPTKRNGGSHRPDRRLSKGGIFTEISERKLGISSDRIIDVLNVKCDPLLIGSLRLKPGFYPAYHMNKDKWISIAMDGSVPSDEIKELVELSYQLTKR